MLPRVPPHLSVSKLSTCPQGSNCSASPLLLCILAMLATVLWPEHPFLGHCSRSICLALCCQSLQFLFKPPQGSLPHIPYAKEHPTPSYSLCTAPLWVMDMLRHSPSPAPIAGRGTSRQGWPSYRVDLPKTVTFCGQPISKDTGWGTLGKTADWIRQGQAILLWHSPKGVTAACASTLPSALAACFPFFPQMWSQEYLL